jgi:predicted GNAT family acetyltransferase
MRIVSRKADKGKKQEQASPFGKVLPSEQKLLELEEKLQKAVDEAESLYAAECQLISQADDAAELRAALQAHVDGLVAKLDDGAFILDLLGLTEEAEEVKAAIKSEAEAVNKAYLDTEEELRLQAETTWDDKKGLRQLNSALLERKRAADEQAASARKQAKAGLLAKLQALIPEAVEVWRKAYGHAHYVASQKGAVSANAVRCSVIRDWLEGEGFDERLVASLSDEDLGEANRALQKLQSAAYREAHPEEAQDKRGEERPQRRQRSTKKAEEAKSELHSGRFDGTWVQVLYENVPAAEMDRLQRDLASLDSLMAVREQHIDVSVGVEPTSKRLMAWANGRSMSLGTKAWWTYLVQ